MLSRLEVTNTAGDTLVLPMTNEGAGYVVNEINGLGPVKASIASSTFANLDGAHYQSSRRDPRNITIKLGFEPDYYDQTIQTMRQALYNWFSTKSVAKLRFHIGTGLDYDITGYVESMETALFSKDPAVDISIMCMNPDFVDSDPSVFSGLTTSTLGETDFQYDGTSPTGFQFTLFPNRTISGFNIYLRSPNGSVQMMEITKTLVDDDLFKINTMIGSKSASFVHASVEESILYTISSQSNWIQLYPGLSHIRVVAEGSPIPYEISYRNYLGGL